MRSETLSVVASRESRQSPAIAAWINRTFEEVELHGDIAIEVSKAILFVEDRQPVDEMKYIVIWKREHGDWKLHKDIFNSSRPAQ